MLSEKQHIDDFFRKKEEAFTPGNHLADAHWQQMRTQLVDPEPKSGNNKAGTQIIRNITKYIGGLIVVIVITILAINQNRSHKRAITKKAKQQATIVTAKIPPAANQGTLSDSINTIATVPVQPYQPTARSIQTRSNEQTGTQETYASDNDTTNEANNPKPDAQALLKTFYEALQKDGQDFYVATNRDTTLIAKEGTRLVIPANIFTHKAAPVKGQVKITIREYFRYEDIIAAKLSTTSNDEQLVTGGMLQISAQQDGENVLIAPQKTITVSIPTDNYDNRMMLFTGTELLSDADNSSILNWLPAGPFQPTFGVHRSSSLKILNIHDVEPASVSYGKKTTAKFYVSSNVAIPRQEIVAKLQQRFGSYYDNIKLRRARKNKSYDNSANGKPLVIDTTTIDMKKAFDLKLISKQDFLSYKETFKQDSINYQKQATYQNQYNFAINSLGWINCDRFLNDPRTKVNFKVDLGKEITVENCNSQLVFTRYQSVLIPYNGSGHKIQYLKLPEGEPVVLVNVAVENDKVVSSFLPLNISNKEIGNLIFEPTTPEQFKQKLQSLFASPKQ